MPHQSLDASFNVLQQKVAIIITGLQTRISEMHASCFQHVILWVLVPTMVCTLVGIYNMILLLFLRLWRNYYWYRNKRYSYESLNFQALQRQGHDVIVSVPHLYFLWEMIWSVRYLGADNLGFQMWYSLFLFKKGFFQNKAKGKRNMLFMPTNVDTTIFRTQMHSWFYWLWQNNNNFQNYNHNWIRTWTLWWHWILDTWWS